MAGVLDGMKYIAGQYDAGQARAKENALAKLYSSAYVAPQAQRGGILAQMAGIDPQSASSASGVFDARQKRQQDSALEIARAWQSTKGQPNREQFYRDTLLGLSRERGIPLPDQYDETAFDQRADALVAMAGPQSGAGVQSTYVDADGNRVAILRDGTTSILGQNAPNNQIIDTGNGFFGVNKGNLRAAPVMHGGGQPQPPQRGHYQTPSGMVYLGDLSPDEWQAAQADIQAGGTATNVQLPPRDVPPQQSGGQLFSAPKPQAPSDFERKVEMARAMGATPEQIRQMVLGDSGGGKPTATQMRQANAAKQKLIDLGAIRAQLKSVSDAFAPLKGTYSAGGIYGVGGNLLPTESGQKFDAAVDLLRTGIRKLTRTPGEGAMSDWEGKMANLANPSRGDREAVTEQKIQQLTEMLDSLEQGYTAILEDNGGSAANIGGGAPPGPSAGNPPTGNDFSNLWN